MLRKVFRLICLLVFLTLLNGQAMAVEKSRSYVQSLTFETSQKSTIIEINFKNTIDYSHDKLKNPERIYFDFRASHIDPEFKNLVQNTKENANFKNIKVAKNKSNVVRMVIELRPTTLVNLDSGGKQLRIRLSKSEDPDLIENFYRAESTKTKNKIWETEKYIIVIDPGHGGRDPGAVGRKGTREKDINLAIAKKLKNRINKEPNMKAVLTREKDKYVKLFNRVKLARKLKPTMFISIHADGAKNRKASGSSVFILPLKGEKVSSRYAERVSLKENQVDLLYDPDIDKREPVVRDTLADLTQNHTARLSQQLGTKVLKQLGRVNNLHKKKVEKANFAVLKAIDVCSILVETAFLSNRTEEKELKSKKYQAKIANAIFLGVKDFLSSTPPEQLGVKLSKQ